MKKILIYKSVLVFLVTISMGCSDSFLDQNPQGVLGESVLENSNGADLALIGAYAMLDGYNDGNNVWPAAPQNWIFGSITTDDAYKGSELGDFGEMTELELYQWSPGNSILGQKYIALYEGVARANNTINLMNASTDAGATQDFKDRVIGEAKFLRAYYHFELWKVWGKIVYFTEETTDLKTPNTDAEAPLAAAITDMESAVSLLPEVQAEVGRADKLAARAMLGKLYMHQGNPGAAVEHLQAVVDSRDLVDCLRDLFQTASENGSSHIFSVQASINDGGNSANANWLNQLAFPAGPEFGCCGFHQPSQNLVNAFKVDATGLPALSDAELNPAADVVDPRLDLTVGRDNVPYWDWAVHTPEWIRSRSYSGPFSPKKLVHYKNETVSGGGWNSNANNGVNFPIIRLADVMLLLAEARVADNNFAAAEALVNAIRVRAGNCSQGPLEVSGSAIGGPDVVVNGMKAQPWATYNVQPYPAGSFNASNALDRVKLERRLELALEGHRFFDLQRWGDAATVLNAFTASEASRREYYGDAAPFEARHRWYPFPSQQIELSKVDGVPQLTQNDDW